MTSDQYLTDLAFRAALDDARIAGRTYKRVERLAKLTLQIDDVTRAMRARAVLRNKQAHVLELERQLCRMGVYQ